jgi:hypothetical protein
MSLLANAEPEYLLLVTVKLLVGAFSSGFRLLVGFPLGETLLVGKGPSSSCFPSSKALLVGSNPPRRHLLVVSLLPVKVFLVHQVENCS